MRGFIFGVIFTLIVGAAAAYAVVESGLIPANADATPSRLERKIADDSLSATIDKEAPTGPVPVALNDDTLTQGMQLYASRCAICHGYSDGSPSPIAKGEYPRPPQLGRRGMGRAPEGHIFWIVEHGIRWTGMPSWKGAISEDDAWKVSLFLKHLSDLPAGPAAAWKAMKRPTPAAAAAAAAPAGGPPNPEPGAPTTAPANP